MMAIPFSRVLVPKFVGHRSISKLLFHSSTILCTATPTTPPKTAAVSETVAYFRKSEDDANKYAKHVDEAVERWAKSNEIYYGKDRDMKNFPPVKYPVTHPKVRLGFLPDSWFTAFYSQTGVTGPYLFLFGSTAFLLSKEIWVVDPHFVELGMLVAIMTWLMKKLGPYVTKYLDAGLQELEQTRYYRPLKALTDNLDRTIATADEEIAKASAVPLLVKAKEENLDLQLEAAYRERLQQVHRAVHRRLDYHVERENSHRHFQQQHMINWVVNNVIKDITPAQEKETLKQCIGELKNLARAYKAAPAY